MSKLSYPKLLAALSTLSLLAVSCATSPRLVMPHAAKLEVISDGNFVLSMNNESPLNPPIDFKVFIDGLPAYSGEIEFTPHHRKTLRFNLARGIHSVYVKSDKVHIWAAQSVEVGDKVWVYVSYWHYREPEGGGPFDPQFRIASRLEEAPIY